MSKPIESLCITDTYLDAIRPVNVNGAVMDPSDIVANVYVLLEKMVIPDPSVYSKIETGAKNLFTDTFRTRIGTDEFAGLRDSRTGVFCLTKEEKLEIQKLIDNIITNNNGTSEKDRARFREILTNAVNKQKAPKSIGNRVLNKVGNYSYRGLATVTKGAKLGLVDGLGTGLGIVVSSLGNALGGTRRIRKTNTRTTKKRKNLGFVKKV